MVDPFSGSAVSSEAVVGGSPDPLPHLRLKGIHHRRSCHDTNPRRQGTNSVAVTIGSARPYACESADRRRRRMSISGVRTLRSRNARPSDGECLSCRMCRSQSIGDAGPILRLLGVSRRFRVRATNRNNPASSAAALRWPSEVTGNMGDPRRFLPPMCADMCAVWTQVGTRVPVDTCRARAVFAMRLSNV